MNNRKKPATTALHCCYVGGLAIFAINGCSAQAPAPTPTPEAAPRAERQAINDGYSVSNTDFPWSVRLNVNGSFQCGGSLIAPDWVLTVAHCIYGGNPANYSVTLGSGKVIAASQLIWHPAYVDDGARTGHYDIGLIRLSELALPSSTVGYIRPAVGDDAPVFDKFGTARRYAKAIGWGMINHDQQNPQLPTTLQAVDLPLLESSSCDNVFPWRHELFADELCAGWDGGVGGVCFGDSGSPLMIQRDSGIWEQIGAPTGVVSTGGEGSCSSYGVFNRTSYLVNWIRNYVPDPALVPVQNTIML